MKKLLFLFALCVPPCLWHTLSAQSLLGSNPPLPQVHATTLAWADYDTDGKPDLLMVGTDSAGVAITLLLRNATTTFPSISHPFHAWPLAAAAWGDLDGDGDPDLLQTGMKPGVPSAGGGKGAVALWRNDSTSGFLSIPCTLPGLRSGAIAWADLDGDGDQDCILAGHNYDQGYISVLARNQTGSLQAIASPFTGFCCGQVAMGDIMGDTLPEVVILGQDRHGNPITQAWHNGGNMQFSPMSTILPALRDGGIAIADMEGDGDGDILAMGLSRPYTLGLWRSDSMGIFPTAALQQAGVILGAIHWADFDGDGLQDVVFGGEAYGGTPLVRALRQYPAGTFTDIQPGSPLLPLFHPTIAIADWSGDGHPDLALSGRAATGFPVTLLYKWNHTLYIFEP